ncbi:28S ribosomal protein S33, mitochondrial-like [Paramacrobiotus metropolitanus]|uniref:28S ribosomal protein S33, mitochondrial-like n=1 Tax=Paramacrobiotus metropolitanus TaxID=2943436 RepID=UPI0024457749|nr:28S ribosomal protein S33, mitochondrial-like [Paramacrobiotus metropolitanus]
MSGPAPVSRYAQMMTRLSRRIFNEPARPMDTEANRIVKVLGEWPREKQGYITNYYPPHPQIWKMIRTLRDHGLFRDEHLDFNEEMERQRALRGKPRPHYKVQTKKKTEAAAAPGAPAAAKKK